MEKNGWTALRCVAIGEDIISLEKLKRNLFYGCGNMESRYEGFIYKKENVFEVTI